MAERAQGPLADSTSQFRKHLHTVVSVSSRTPMGKQRPRAGEGLAQGHTAPHRPTLWLHDWFFLPLPPRASHSRDFSYFFTTAFFFFKQSFVY